MVTLTEFRALAEQALGPERAQHVVRSHHLSRWGGRTAVEAIDGGASVRDVWRALCDDFDVAPELRDPER